MSATAQQPPSSSGPGRRRTRRRRRVAALLATACLGLAAPTAAYAAPDGPSAPNEPAAPNAPSPVLDQARSGEDAIRVLGSKLPEAAARNGRTATELAALLREDPTMWLDAAGRLLAKDPAPARPHPGAAAAAGGPEAAPYPNADTFRLHSKRGAARVIFLDFDGHTVANTVWNGQGVSTRPQPPLDLDGKPGTWSQAEHNLIQSVYQRVAEDFAPLDVDVTTRDPGEAAIKRSSLADTAYGTRVLITPSKQAREALCSNCGGVAYVGIFDEVNPPNTFDQPAWAFSDLSNDAKYIAETVSHEAGHNLGLVHDGTAEDEYYFGLGDGNWAPIMGSGAYQPVVQWSRGDYPGANNKQDDFAVMRSNGVRLRADDHGSAPGTARALGTATAAAGIIESRTDRDVFSLARSCTGKATVSVRPAPTSPNLDVKLRLLSTTGAVLAQNDPPSGEDETDFFDVATGLSASVTTELKPGTYFLEVDGVGVRTPATGGYNDYGSVGQYSVAISPCAAVPTSRLLLTPPDLRGYKGGGWARRTEDLTPKATREPLASCTNPNATLSPSVARTFAKTDPVDGWVPEGPSVAQRVVRYQPGKGDDVMNLFRGVVKQCPTRTLPSGSRQQWSIVQDTVGTSTDTLIIRRMPLGAFEQPYPSYRVVVRDQDVVSLIEYFPSEGTRADEAGAKQLATISAARLPTAR